MSRVSVPMGVYDSNQQELSQMQMDDENMPQISGVVSAKGLATESQARPRQSLTRARSVLTDIDSNSGVNEPQKQRQSLLHQQAQQTSKNSTGHAVRPLKVRADQESLENEAKRVSLKRQATDSSSDFLEQGTQEVKKAKVEHDYKWDDLDADDADDPLMVSEYVNDIFEYLHELEIKTLPDPNYLHWQRNLRPKMRSILVDWMVEVHLKFRLLPETLYLAINIMDRFMSRESVQVDRLQLLATGSLFIAAKYEEVYSPSVKNYAYVTDGGFTEEEILNAEKFILEILKFNMSYPNPMNFLRRISKADDYDVQSRTIGKYLLEISIIDHKFIGYLPSLCSAAAMYIARKMVAKNEWNGNLIHYSGGYKESDLKEVSEMIIDYLISPIVHEEFFKKYASRKFMKVSILARQWAKRITSEGKNIMDAVL
ncbi:hypothetical protein OGAPHI_002213 [Ogataea philodendri]|uniref:Cyclin N-terminal domain-containing protein n=1 Tax=Ogataea philodendri TaxID=1378263 RepID=A0A9P8PBZ9_9ASCO|nr:uncharacterized protein OGAPHI_002213 [Ogataea philodendri]KAH3668459.1 hypothetical protein OGAPHI_002213 [Ogataea philodendri]